MLEELIYKHLSGRQEITDKLAQYRKTAAVFNQTAPPDVDEGWDKGQYPRVVYNLNANSDVERKVAGTLQVDVYVQNGEGNPENFAAIIKASLDGYFFSDENKTYSMQWESTQYLTMANEPITAASVLFSFLEYPSQLTGNERDPIGIINAFTKELYPNARVIGNDDISGAWVPSNTSPAVFWRYGERVLDEKLSRWGADFYKLTVYGHVIAPGTEIMNTMARGIIYELYCCKILQFPDRSWMRVDWDNRFRINADIRRDGQIEIKVTYCERQSEKPAEMMNYINTSHKGAMKNGE
ncbi:MAG: hypothetical protein Q4G33_04595 [bacterium]|nr:hypothetical protein [bacterium]